jgi:hypothetical protein
MKCYYHPSEEAVATCTECGMAMCEKCFNASERTGLCPSCRIEAISAERKKIKSKGNKRLFVAVVWGVITLALAIGVAALLAFLNDKIQAFFAPKGKIALIVIACIAGSLVIAAFLNSVSAAVKAHAAQKADDKLEYAQRKLYSLIKVANKNKMLAKTEEKK